jgi:hypothetical protein
LGKRTSELIVVAVLAVVSVVAAIVFPGIPATGMVGRYWAGTALDGPPAAEATGVSPSIDDLRRHVRSAAVGPSAAEWTGSFFIRDAGVRRVELRTETNVAVFIDEHVVVAHQDGDGNAIVSASTGVAAGRHTIRIRYVEPGPARPFDLLWGLPGDKPTVFGSDDVAPSIRAALRLPHLGRMRVVAVMIPVAWACLFLYVPVRLVSRWTWREVRRVAPDHRHRRALALLLLLALVLIPWGLTWGMGGGSWAPDELRPDFIRDALRMRYSGGWFDKYPVMHYAVLGLPVGAFELADRFGILPAQSLTSGIAQLVLIRCVSVVMALGTLVTLFLCSAEMSGPRRAVCGPLVLLLTPLFLYYGKMANLDIPALYWFAWALLAFLRLFHAPGRRDYVLLGTAAAAAVATKDQAYASLALLIPAVIGLTARQQPYRVWWRRLASALIDTRLLAGAAATIVASVVFHNLIFNVSGVVEHFKLLATLTDLAVVPRTVGGYIAMSTQTVVLFRLSLGWPFFVLAVVGIISAARHRSRQHWLWLLLVPLSFHLTFTWFELYICDRYLFTGILVLSLFAGATLADLLESRRHRRAGPALVAVSLLASLLYAASINVMMTRDARAETRVWVNRHVTGRALVGMVGRYMPAMNETMKVRAVSTIADIERERPDIIIVNRRYAQRYLQDRASERRDLVRALEAGSIGYDLAWRHRGALPFWAWLQYDSVYRRDAESPFTNLDKVNPEMLLLVRRDRLPDMAK